MKTPVFRFFALGVLAATTVINTASAAVSFTSGSFGFTASTTSTVDVTTATTFALNPSSIQPTSGAGDFVGVSLPANLTLPAGAVNFNLVGCCNWTDASIGTFVGTIAPVQTQTASNPASASWDVVGQFTVGTNWTNSGDVFSANMTWVLTQAASTAATSVTGTFYSPRLNAVPEPATLALFGLGLAGLGAVRRRKTTS